MASSPPGACDQCKATGLPILPVRYTVVPKDVSPALPGWASAERVKSVDIGADFKYALRTVRTGFIYLFYEKHARGNKYWECYSVSQDGGLTRQTSTKSARAYLGTRLLCANHSHVAVGVHYLVIEQPDKCGATWIAFSQDKWSDETVKEYTTNTKLRNARMQTIHPAEMIGGAKHTHGAVASKDALEGVIEYSPSVNTHALPHAAEAGDVSTGESGDFSVTQMQQMSTRYPWALRVEDDPQTKSPVSLSTATVTHMQSRAKAKGGKPGSPHVLALWDAIGIAHELNGFRNDAAGWIKKYGGERELQITAANAIKGAKKSMEKRARDQAEGTIARVRGMPDPMEMREQRARQWVAMSLNDPDAQKELADVLAARQSAVTDSARGADQFRKNSTAQAWPKYEERLDRSALTTFKTHWDAMEKAAAALIDRRTVALIHWLEDKLFIDTLEDFHRTSATDGVMFEDCVGTAIFGMGSSPAGQKKIDEWIKEAKSSIDTNLLWRAIALNQEEGLPVIDDALSIAYGRHTPLTVQAWANVGGQVKWNKVFDLAKKSLTAFNTQQKALNDPNSGIKAVETMRSLDKIFLTVGGRWLKPITGTVDLVNEVLLRTMLLVRSGGTVSAALGLGASDAAANCQERAELIRRLKNQVFYQGAAASAEYEEKARKWAALRGDVEAPDAKRGNFNAARDARLALIVAVFEAYNLYKANAEAAKSPGNEKVLAALTAAKFATAGAALDVTSNWVKALAGAGDKAVSYQALKLGGGALSAVASGYGAALDFEALGKEKDAGDYRMATLYFMRGWFQATGAVLGSLTALSYCSPLIEAFGKKFGERMIGKLITQAAARLLLARAALVFASLEVSIFLLFLTFIIWGFSDDDLQKWCDRCAFGLKRKTLPDAYKATEPQLKAFHAALTGVE